MVSSMFDEFKKVKYFKEIKGLKSLQLKAEAYLELKRASMMELFVNTVSKYIAPSKMFDWVIYTLRWSKSQLLYRVPFLLY